MVGDICLLLGSQGATPHSLSFILGTQPGTLQEVTVSPLTLASTNSTTAVLPWPSSEPQSP